MEILTESAFAKLNLTLDVLSRREDGYHDIRSVEQTISLRDDVVLNVGTGRKWALHCYQERVRDGAEDMERATECYPQDAENLAWKAAEVFFDRTGHDPEGLEIFINKRIPMQAGLGGGSADAAAVLRALNRHYGAPLSIGALSELGFSIGADVPFCVMRGERITKLPDVPEIFFVVCKPDFSISTPELYRAIDGEFIEKRPDHKAMIANLQKGDLLGVGGSIRNVFEPLVMKEHFDVNYIKSKMCPYGAYGAQMTGSGAAVFGVYDSFEYATVACTMLRDKYSQVYLATSV